MKKNKKLQKVVDESLTIYKDMEFLETLKIQISERTKKRKKILCGLTASLGTFTLIVAIVCALIFLPINKEDINSSENSPEKHYSLENIETSDSNILELNDLLKSIKLADDGIVSVKCVKDSFYNEILYFVVDYNLNDGLDKFTFIIDINKDYEYKFGYSDFNNSVNLSNIKINYLESYEEEDGIFYFQTKGEVLVDEFNIYVEYEGINFNSNNNFLDLIAMIIK